MQLVVYSPTDEFCFDDLPAGGLVFKPRFHLLGQIDSGSFHALHTAIRLSGGLDQGNKGALCGLTAQLSFRSDLICDHE